MSVKSKNIHVLPTDKPSKLFYNVGGALLFTKWDNYNGVNIYITSDEEIKEGDYFIAYSVTIDKKPYISCASEYKERKKEKGKIILTTDVDLIKDGVQSINDEFLEWFVKNPSCESVEVEKMFNVVQFTSREYIYKIIIPKEEPKQETLEEAVQKVANSDDFINGALFGSLWQQERMYSKQETENIAKEAYKIGIIGLSILDFERLFNEKTK